ncbi:MAG: Smr/MutS family protein, partial [Candidatus Uhrbacteria bacterium]|nr:Smr/MutS family protein [Candidatus Uhrbacteria bacterium]
ARTRSREATHVPEVDLHGLRQHIGEQRVANFMHEQIANGACTVKIIHGNGQGVMREVAYDWIRKHAHRVTQHEDVGPAVIVYLK